MCVLCRVKFDKDAMSKTKTIMANLKSTGQSKFALDEKEEVLILTVFWSIGLICFVYIWYLYAVPTSLVYLL